jgi:hypothetical protein
VLASPATPTQLDATTPLRLSGLSRRALNALARCQVHTVGELLALAPAQIRAIHAIGSKTAGDVIALPSTRRVSCGLIHFGGREDVPTLRSLAAAFGPSPPSSSAGLPSAGSQWGRLIFPQARRAYPIPQRP